MFSEVMYMSVQSKIDGEFSVLVDNISKIALAIERKGVHSSGELSNYHSEIDSIVVDSSEDKKKEIIVEFAKKLGYSSVDDIISNFDRISNYLGLFNESSDIGLFSFSLLGSSVENVRFKYTIVGGNGKLYTSDLLNIVHGENTFVRHISSHHDSLFGVDIPDHNRVYFYADISKVGGWLKQISVEVYVGDTRVEFRKSDSLLNPYILYSWFNSTKSNMVMGYTDGEINPNSTREVFSKVRKIDYIFNVSSDGTTLTTYDDYINGVDYNKNADFGFVNHVGSVPSGVTYVTNGTTVDRSKIHGIEALNIKYSLVSAAVDAGYTYKFTPLNQSIIDKNGFVGMLDAKQSIGVTLWTGEVVVFPEGSNKYDLRTKQFSAWDGSFEVEEDHL